MWPFEPQRDVLRIGRLSVELWQREPAGLVRRLSRTLSGADGLGTEVRGLLKSKKEGRVSLDVVLESAWMPVVLFETGPEVWARSWVEGLLRHRLSQVYDDRGDSVSGWDIAFDHRPGERFGVGYGLSPKVRAAVEEAFAAAHCGIGSLQPAWQWGMRKLPSRSGWWVWLEQDRAVAAFVDQGRVSALHPAAALPGNPAALAKMIRIEQLRAGLENVPSAITLAGWEAPFALDSASGLKWQGLAAADAERARAVHLETAA